LKDMVRTRRQPIQARSTGAAERMALQLGITPRGGPASIATPAAPKPRSISIWTINPPNECPIRIGGSGIALI
jgi:hypothetical protein